MVSARTTSPIHPRRPRNRKSVPIRARSGIFQGPGSVSQTMMGSSQRWCIPWWTSRKSAASQPAGVIPARSEVRAERHEVLGGPGRVLEVVPAAVIVAEDEVAQIDPRAGAPGQQQVLGMEPSLPREEARLDPLL